MELWFFEVQWYDQYDDKIITDRGITFGEGYGNIAERIEKRYENIEWMTITPVDSDFFFADNLEQYKTWIEMAKDFD